MNKQKKELRSFIKSLLDKDKEKLSSYTKQIEDSLFRNKKWQESGVIGVTISRGNEVETRGIIEKAWSEGKKVAIPKCFPEGKSMTFYVFTDYNQLEEVYFGLKEPNPEKTNAISPSEINMVLVPGVVYTAEGYRIGYGGGYYDRFLTNYKGYTISLLFECQLVSSIPIEKHDIPVQELITEERTIVCG